jgi:hypothetical protein
MKNIATLIITMTTLAIITSCSVDTIYVPYTTDPTGDTNLPVKTIYWEDTMEGFTQFYTNDSKYIGVEGRSFWKIGELDEQPMTSYEVEVQKVSGDSYTGYGIVFCADTDDADSFYIFSIDCTGYYHVLQIVDEQLDSQTGILVPWTFSEHLIKGYEKSNTVTVEYLGDNAFGFSINGHRIINVTDDTVPQFDGGKYGYICGVSKYEDFPNAPVDVRFKEL